MTIQEMLQFCKEEVSKGNGDKFISYMFAGFVCDIESLEYREYVEDLHGEMVYDRFYLT